MEFTEACKRSTSARRLSWSSTFGKPSRLNPLRAKVSAAEFQETCVKQLASSIIGIAMALGFAVQALAFTPAPRAFNVTFDGFYLVTNNNASSHQVLKG